MLLWAHGQFDTRDIASRKLGDCDREIDEVSEFLRTFGGDFRICFAKGSSVLIGRDVFGRKSLVGRVEQREDGDFTIVVAVRFTLPHADVFEFPPGALFRLDGVRNVRQSAFGMKVEFELPAAAFDERELLVHSHYDAAELPAHPFFGRFKRLRVERVPSYDLLIPSADFSRSPTEAEVEAVADELIERLSACIRGIFEPKGTLLPLHVNPSVNPGNQLSIFFSGGVDSLAVAVIAARVFPHVRQFNLINTVFGESEEDFAAAHDRRKALECFEFLNRNYENRFCLVPVNVTRAEVAEWRPQIRVAMQPKGTILDESLAAVLSFSARAVGERVFAEGHEGFRPRIGPLILVGSGSDELLAGYSRHRKVFEAGGWAALHAELRMEIGRIADRNFGRDDRAADSFGRALVAPFMEEEFVRWINGVPLPVRVDFAQPRGVGEKRLLRVALRRLGLPLHLTDTPKKAMQFGSNYAKLENRGMKGGDRAIDL